jgi:hypothetical protein
MHTALAQPVCGDVDIVFLLGGAERWRAPHCGQLYAPNVGPILLRGSPERMKVHSSHVLVIRQ